MPPFDNGIMWSISNSIFGSSSTHKKLSDIPIIRHVKIKSDANPFDPQWDNYFDSRYRKAIRVMHPEAFINFGEFKFKKICKSR